MESDVAGQSLLLDLLRLTAHDAMVSASISPAALYRVMEQRRPTLLIDEADTIFGRKTKGDSSKEDLRGMLNAGFQRGRVTLRMGGARMTTLEEFDPYGPKALAGIGNLPDTITDRSIPINLQRKPHDMTMRRFRARIVNKEGEGIAEMLASVFSADGVADVLAEAWPTLPEALNDRAQDIWEPLFALADWLGEGWPARARTASLVLSGEAEADEQSLGVQLLTDLVEIFEGHGNRLSAHVVDALNNLDESPWGGWNNGKGITQRWLAMRLRPFGVKSRTVRDGIENAKGYRSEDLHEPWSRYLSPSVTSVTTQLTIDENDDFARVTKRHNP